MFSKLISVVVPALLLASVAQAASPIERSIGNVNKRSVGALTPLSTKTTICNVLDYGAVADGTTDIAPAIESAFSNCASGGGATIYVPPGNYSIATGVTLNKGSAYAFQIDGLITLTADGSFGGNAIVLERTSDVEIFSSNGLGAINGQGYLTRKNSSGQNARLFRIIDSSDISIHDMLFIDSPTFHLIFNEVSNLKAYHITVRGPDIGGTDGIDLICTDNCYLHDIEVTNRDECISVKSPSSNVLIENIYCNHSGGMSIGSLTADDVDSTTEAQVSNITMRDIYSYQCTQMLMIKTFPGGSGATGYVKDSIFENFWAYDTTYGLDIDQYWETHTTPDTGAVQLSGLTFSNWTGTVDNGLSRGPIVIRGSDIVPLTDITLEDFNMWTVNGKELVHQCKNVYGTGYCAASSSGSSLATFTTSMTVTATPTGYVAPTSPTWAVSGYGTTDPIPVYTPAAFWSPVSSGVASSSVTAAAAVVQTSSAAAVSSVKTTSAVKTSAVKTSSTGKTSTKKTTSTKKSTKTHAPRVAAVVSSATEVSAVQASSVSVASSYVSSAATYVSSAASSKTPCSSSVASSIKAAYSSSVAASFSSAAAISASTGTARVSPAMPVASGSIIASMNSTSTKSCSKPASSVAAAYSSSIAASFSSAAAATTDVSAVSSGKKNCTKPASSLAAAHASSVASSFSAVAASSTGLSAIASSKKNCTKPASSLSAAHASSVAASFASAAASTGALSKNCTKPASSVAAAHASSVSAGFATGLGRGAVFATGSPSTLLTATHSGRRPFQTHF